MDHPPLPRKELDWRWTPGTHGDQLDPSQSVPITAPVPYRQGKLPSPDTGSGGTTLGKHYERSQ